jgi:hypothetical protein
MRRFLPRVQNHQERHGTGLVRQPPVYLYYVPSELDVAVKKLMKLESSKGNISTFAQRERCCAVNAATGRGFLPISVMIKKRALITID